MSVCFQAESALVRLRELDEQPHPSAVTRILASRDRKARMRVDEITTEEALFQPRGGLNEDHVETLRKAKRNRSDLDPILVIQVGPRTILLDGHHRLEVYKRVQQRDPKRVVTIPVEFFSGGLEEALDEAGTENTKARLPMTSEERNNYAWRRTVLGIGSIAQVARVSGVSERTVTTMRQVRDKINAKGGRNPRAKAGFYPTWKEARREVRDDTSGVTQDYEEYMDQKAKTLADALYKQHGTAFTSSPRMTARVIAIMFGDRVGEVQKELRDILSDDDEDPEEETEEVSENAF